MSNSISISVSEKIEAQTARICPWCKFNPAECEGVPKLGWDAGKISVGECDQFAYSTDEESDIEKQPTNSLRERILHDLNCVSAENGSDTPDFILAEYLIDCLAAFDKATNSRSKWYSNRKQGKSK